MGNTSSYSVGYGKHVVSLFTKRTVQQQAQHLIPYLKPSSTILDCGCGPGSITLDFARYAYAGAVSGIDLEHSQIEFCKNAAKEQGISNVEFKQGSIMHIPFPDNSFDIVHAHAVLCQLNSPLDAIKEMMRVAKPGGIVAVREMDWRANLIHPESPLLVKEYQIRKQAIDKMGGDYFIGGKLRGLFNSAQFAKVEAGASCEVCGDAGSITEVSHYIAKQWEDAPFVKLALDEGWVNQEEIKQIQQALIDYAKQEDAFRAWTWCFAIGHKS
ncbi:MAG: methyltransferase type 11 [Gammaproteobacteria bacterium]|jgi:ubiquinone/menaquinone biosynthesis C-methylase UbiE|nr:methyltransferase type 11 [Gammaproteobacteria bacterium]